MNFDKFKTKEELRLAIEKEKESLDTNCFEKDKIKKINRMIKYYNGWEAIKWLEGNVVNYRRNYKK